MRSLRLHHASNDEALESGDGLARRPIAADRQTLTNRTQEIQFRNMKKKKIETSTTHTAQSNEKYYINSHVIL